MNAQALIHPTRLAVWLIYACCAAAACSGSAWASDGTPSGNVSASWPQWGGPNRDFKVDARGLADKWPDNGPKQLWNRPLGEGYSAVVADQHRLYTMYRQGDNEIVIALQPGTGQTIWEHRYPAPPYADQDPVHARGPHATPLLLDDRIVAIGVTGLLHCLDAATGRVLWSHNLVKDFGGRVQYYGYASSPLAYDGNIIVLVGGESCGVVALNRADGSVVWKSGPCEISYASPILINVDGQDQIVFFSPDAVIGMDAKGGAFLWRHTVANFCKTNCTTAIWGEGNLLWAATKSVGGTRVLKLNQKDGQTSVTQVWSNRKVRIDFWNAIRIGDFVCAASGDNVTFLSVIDIQTGEVLLKERGFGQVNGLCADGKLIFLDDSGMLTLAKVSREKIEVVSSVQLLNSVTWTVPTLVGTRLYVRDRERILALDLG
jgi:outer membrane protein assembly factor BamB